MSPAATTPSTSDVLAALLAARPPVTATPSLPAWLAATAATRSAFPRTIDRALVGGALADRVGFAFAAGYTEALRYLVPALADTVAALCATEQDGNHPRAIRTRLAPIPGAPAGRYTLTGEKRWATGANAAATLLVVASEGDDPATGRNRLRVVRVPTTAPNLRIRSTPAPFVPEIEHAELSLDGVEVTEADLLPGDGYTAYLKPFRTVEDLHVHAAVLGYLVGVARRRALDPALVESLLAVAAATRALADADPSAAATHLALAGVLAQATHVVGEVERAWSAAAPTDDDDEWRRWQRDRPLLQVAGKARAARREAARAALRS